jgi:hypothetical protein
MKFSMIARFALDALRPAALLALTATCGLAAATLTQQIDPPEVNVGDPVTVTITVQNGNIGDVHLPAVDGLEVLPGLRTSSNFSFINGSLSSTVSKTFELAASRAGDFTIPAFDIPLQDGGTLHTQPMTLHVLAAGGATSPASGPSASNPPASVPSLPSIPTPNPGPVVLPPSNGTDSTNDGNSADSTNPNVNVPVETDGRPAKVFVSITPKTTDAYVGEAIPLRIDFYIRLDVAYQQDSLPTIKGSDFLMNNLSVRPGEDEVMLMNEEFHRESWVTAISAPKSGDFPLSMERDTYWIKSNGNSGLDPFGSLFTRPSLAHESIASNQLTIHVHALPAQGQPADFTGAIGQLKVTGTAQPESVAVGDPVTLHFTVSGEGNFDYIRCPALAGDPAWKAYVPSSKISYADESHTHGVKTFEQAVIPQKNGTLPLPAASFSYFDPVAKQYVTEPIAFPPITVTGASPASLASTTAGNENGASAASPAPNGSGLDPNRLDLGSPRPSLAPAYRQPWFWIVQGALLALPLLAAFFLLLWSRSPADDGRAERALQRRSLQQEETVMAEAVQRGDAVGFFVAARHAVQLQLGAQWRVKPEAITLGEIRLRDPHLAESLEPLFVQADEIIYSGQASPDIDLAQWEHRVRTELLQPQPA